jgi:hypothetical protein
MNGTGQTARSPELEVPLRTMNSNAKDELDNRMDLGGSAALVRVLPGMPTRWRTARQNGFPRSRHTLAVASRDKPVPLS